MPKQQRNRCRCNQAPVSAGQQAVRCLVLATLAGILGILGMMLVLAGLLSVFSLPVWVARPASLAVGCVGALVAGFACARLNQKNGFFLGMGCAALLFLLLLVVSVASGQAPGTFSLVKLFSMLLCGALGGSLGVNTSWFRKK